MAWLSFVNSRALFNALTPFHIPKLVGLYRHGTGTAYSAHDSTACRLTAIYTTMYQFHQQCGPKASHRPYILVNRLWTSTSQTKSQQPAASMEQSIPHHQCLPDPHTKSQQEAGHTTSAAAVWKAWPRERLRSLAGRLRSLAGRERLRSLAVSRQRADGPAGATTSAGTKESSSGCNSCGVAVLHRHTAPG
jgi:hypothetical protein